MDDLDYGVYAQDMTAAGYGAADVDAAQLSLPPHSVEAEQSLLGGLLIDNQAWDRVADLVNEHDFYRHEHKLIFVAVKKLLELLRPADVVTVFDQLKEQEEDAQSGGMNYLIDLAKNTPSSANIRRYAEIVRERSVMRQLAQVGTDIARNAFNPQGKSAADLLDAAENEVFQIRENSARGQSGFQDMKTVLDGVIERIDMLADREDKDALTGIASGFTDLDKLTSGFQPGDLIIVAGRPSMGKTAFAMNIAEFVGAQLREPVAVFSMEMGAEQLALRMVGSLGRLDQHVLRTGQLNGEQWNRLGDAVDKLNDAPIFIDETPGLTALEVRARTRRLARLNKGRLGLVVIDYLQLMSGSGRSDNRTMELGEISRSIKSLARELKVPVIALSQLSRQVEQRADKRPLMSDLRESGAIEQDADLIIFMYRDEYYNRDSQFKGLAEAIVGKHRNGSTGVVNLAFLGQYVRFENVALEHYDV